MFGKSQRKAGSGNDGKKQHKSLRDMQESSPEQNLSKLEDDVTAVIAGTETGQNNFFCTDEPFITRFDDKEILHYIQKRIPLFGVSPGSPSFKQSIFDFLEDDDFMELVMDEFDLSPDDMFKFLFRLDPFVFKGMFMKRIREIVLRKQYGSV